MINWFLPLFDITRPKKNKMQVRRTTRNRSVLRAAPRRKADGNDIAIDVPIRNTNLQITNFILDITTDKLIFL